MSAATEKETEALTLSVIIKGEVISNNFPEFKAQALKRIASMDYKLLNDDDFAKAAEDVKVLKAAEDATKIAEKEILKQLTETYEIITGLGEIRKASSDSRLKKAREIKEREEAIRKACIDSGVSAIDSRFRERFRDQVTDALKGKRGKKKIQSWQEAADATAKSVNSDIEKSRDALNQFEEEHGSTLIPDREELELKAVEVIEGELISRVKIHEAKMEAERLKAEAAEAKAKANAEKKAALEKEEADKKAAEVPAEKVVDFPDPPKVGSIPVGSSTGSVNRPVCDGTHSGGNCGDPNCWVPADSPLTLNDEFEIFKKVAIAAFEPMAPARTAIKNPTLKQAAQVLADDFADAWKKFVAATKS